MSSHTTAKNYEDCDRTLIIIIMCTYNVIRVYLLSTWSVNETDFYFNYYENTSFCMFKTL